MNREAVLHNPVSNYAFPLSYEKFKVRLRAGKGDLDRVTLVIGNKYLWRTRKEFPMEVEGSDQLFDYYSYVYQVDDPRVAYYFLLEKGDEQWLYGDSGFAKPDQVNLEEDESSAFVNFQFPFINPIDIHKKPSWVNSAVFYQIFPERFCNGNPKLSPENVAPWGTKPDRQVFMGGDLPGITQKLPYLEDLGVNALYLTPIFEATSNHKYDTVDYTRIDPHFGDETDLVELINQAHKRGIRVILDGVFNHCGGGFRQFQDVAEHGEDSPFRDWFYIREFPVSFDPLNFDSFGDTPYVPRHPSLKALPEEQLRTACMPKWNTENPQVKEYLLGAVAKWTRMGIDGWRLDVATEVDSHFWREFRETVRGINPDALIIGEFWRNSEAWLRGDQYDGVMNYGVQRAAVEYFAKSAITPLRFQEILTENLMRYSDAANDSMLNLLDSHDTARFLTVSGGDTARLRNAAAFLFTFVGMPCTYYGTEIGMTGENDPDCRKAFDWDPAHWDVELRDYYKKLMSLRKTRKALQEGSVKLCSQGEVFVMERRLEGELLVTAINNTDLSQRCVLKGTSSRDLLGGDLYTGERETLSIELPPFTSMILKLV
ncbi:glycoside hydrolase family 13 protein [Evtepia gabavorous]|uniref:glycoside hydrolase family 13 protein n=2 Tax=Eubacteriales TaxID=186802 RepID=UPI003AEF1ECA